MKLIPGRVAIQAGIKTRFHRCEGLLFRHVVLPRVPDNFFQFQAQHPIQRCPLLCRNHLACPDQLLVKTDGGILFQGKPPFYTLFTRIMAGRKKSTEINWGQPLIFAQEKCKPLCLAQTTQTASHFVSHSSISLLDTKRYNDFRIMGRCPCLPTQSSVLSTIFPPKKLQYSARALSKCFCWSGLYRRHKLAGPALPTARPASANALVT